MSTSLQIAFVATECVPFIKIGGLGDVVGSLPRALRERGLGVDIVLPFEPGESSPPIGSETRPLSLDIGGRQASAAVYSTTLPDSDIRVLLVRDETYFPRGGIYQDPSSGHTYPDQLERWVFFQHAALALIAQECPDIDVIHCHEHQTGLVPAYVEHVWRPRGVFTRTATVFTIHNLGYQGIFSMDSRAHLFLPEAVTYPGGPVEFYGQVNLMKCGIQTADAVTVVSPTYAEEIQTEELGYGLHGVIAGRRKDLYGILNGIDPTEWNPESDPHIAATYSASAPDGKQRNRQDLIRSFGLDESDLDTPLLGMVSRIDTHKGFDLLLGVLGDLLTRKIRIALVGTGDPVIQHALEGIRERYPSLAGMRFAFDNRLAHRVIAGADILLMPSRYEPCGLTQLYGLRYGTVPVVRATGGLADTVTEFDPETGTGTGFRFQNYSGEDFRGAIDRAVAAWKGPTWPTIVRNGMAQDFTWTRSAGQYADVYARVVGQKI